MYPLLGKREIGSDAVPTLSLPALLLQFLRIGAIGFGGGMAIIALMERDLIQKRRVLKPEEFLHGVGLGQVLGPFGVNAALFIGNRLYGTLGGLACAFAVYGSFRCSGDPAFLALFQFSCPSSLAEGHG